MTIGDTTYQYYHVEIDDDRSNELIEPLRSIQSFQELDVIKDGEFFFSPVLYDRMQRIKNSSYLGETLFYEKNIVNPLLIPDSGYTTS